MAAEHRYYGTSRPFGANPTPEQFGWLTIEQAYLTFQPLFSSAALTAHAAHGAHYWRLLTAVFGMDGRLADYAVIVLHVKELYNTSNPVYCFGGSYGGLLSALLRIKYGNVFWGSVASAAPLFGNRADPESWFHLVSLSFIEQSAFSFSFSAQLVLTSLSPSARHRTPHTHAGADHACGENIRQAYRMMHKLSATQEGRDKIAVPPFSLNQSLNSG